MAKKRRPALSDIQDALHAQTRYLTGGEAPLPLSTDTLHKLQVLAEYQGTTVEALLQLAVDDLLSLRARQLKTAMDERGEA
jgi:hypothetical protein